MIPVRENSEVVIIYPEKLLFTVRSGIVLHHLVAPCLLHGFADHLPHRAGSACRNGKMSGVFLGMCLLFLQKGRIKKAGKSEE